MSPQITLVSENQGPSAGFQGTEIELWLVSWPKESKHGKLLYMVNSYRY